MDATAPGRATGLERASAPRLKTGLQGLVLAAVLALGGCLQPMYGQLSEGGKDLQGDLQAIAIEPIPDRIGHYLGDDLIFDLNGTGSHVEPKYRLYVTLSETSQTPLLDTVTGIATSSTIVINGDYRLVKVGTAEQVTAGHVFVFKSYDRNSDRYGNVRAARDAEIQDAKQISDQIRIRLAAALSHHPAGM
ncbi:hypothetical protein RHAL1_03833 [Beijerinckiaceae bacterium RH AL1]|nr:hypothetical protein [Beijerinckiaceae bacterium]VVB49431.1 hypothetical protein RHCH11_RHCH11_03759 [Beijerinckiaceae bacterium RH CH11]VVB49512.1 hypothetical protein RHAL8_03755 [Beijerinckiaceae bacterium RH AL8]VVC56899.1 hypothetical protein RHAL1_03833 [Beijerinckiaceae bacterium RH AL1]